MSPNYFRTILFFACALAALGQSAPGQLETNSSQPAQIEVDGSVLRVSVDQNPQPLAAIVKGLDLKFGWNVNYETPRYDSPENLDDITPRKSLTDNPQGIKASGLKPGSFSFSFPDFDPADPKSESRTLDAIVKAYNQSNNPGKFELLAMDDGSFNVAGIAAAHGPQPPVLNTKISLSIGQVSASEALDAWAQELTRVSGLHVVNGGISAEKVFMPAQITIHADNLPAREVLRQIINATGRNCFWDLGSSEANGAISYPLTLTIRINAVFGTRPHQNDPAPPPTPAGDPSTITQGRARFHYYQCDQCHGAKGEGTSDGPDLISTQLSPAEISKFIVAPSPDARMKGMPDIPSDNPDHQAIVAFVVSLKRTPPR
jgi:mono/diheme cytochrome c family protein